MSVICRKRRSWKTDLDLIWSEDAPYMMQNDREVIVQNVKKIVIEKTSHDDKVNYFLTP